MDGYILVGGKGSRLGKDKTGLVVGGLDVLERMHAAMARHFDRVCLVGGNGEAASRLGLEWVRDASPGWGPLGGIQAGLEHCRGSHAFFAACDLPFFDGNFAAYLAGQVNGYDAVVPTYRGFFEPMYAVYGRSCLPAIASALARGDRRVTAFFPHVKGKLVPEEVIREFGHPQVLFFNINTVDDLITANRLAGPHPRARLAGGDEAPVLSVVGSSNTGKTRLVSLLVKEYGHRGYRVATVKHAAGGFQFDRPGSDTHQHLTSGAVAVAVVGPGSLGLVERGEFGLATAIARMGQADLVIAEGFKREDWAKVEVLRQDVPGSPVLTGDPRLIAVVADEPVALTIPVFGSGEIASLASHVEMLLGLKPGRE